MWFLHGFPVFFVNLYVAKFKKHQLDFEIDGLTNSIENVVTGDSFATNVTLLTKDDLKQTLKKDGWDFDWKYELKQPERVVYKLTIVDNISVVQGIISLEIKSDHIYLHLIESAPFNKGRNKVYKGVPGNLVAFACKLAFENGFDGTVSFISKTHLIDHYIESLGAFHFGGHLMVITTEPAQKLVDKYFK
jgi:hypothetical protein